MFVDGFDGMLARWFHVKEYAKDVDGGLMDNIIDYLNYVVVAAFILIKAPNLMPAGFELPALSLLSPPRLMHLAVEAVELYVWDRAGSDN